MARVGQYKALGASLGGYKKTLGDVQSKEYAKAGATSKAEFEKGLYSSIGTAVANVVGIVQEQRAITKQKDFMAREYGIGGDEFAQKVTEKGLKNNPYLESQKGMTEEQINEQFWADYDKENPIIPDTSLIQTQSESSNQAESVNLNQPVEDIFTRSQRIIDENESLYQKTIEGGEIKSGEQLTPLEGLPTTDIGGIEFTNLTGPQLPEKINKSPFLQDPKDYKPTNLNPTDSNVFNTLADPLAGDLDTDTQYSSPIEKLMLTKSEFKKSGASKDKLDELIDVIGTVESGNQNIAQIGGGPGRGIFQFETGEGKGMHTALNRIKRMYTEKKHLGQDTYPSWIDDASNPNHENYLDATKLSPSQQRELLIADLYMKKGSDKNLKKAFSTGDYKDLWLENHWAGADKDKESKSAYYDSVMSNYKPRKY